MTLELRNKKCFSTRLDMCQMLDFKCSQSTFKLVLRAGKIIAKRRRLHGHSFLLRLKGDDLSWSA